MSCDRARRVLVAVTPRLLSDTLSKALSSDHLHVEAYPPDGFASPSQACARFDLALVDDAVPPDVVADVVITLEPTPDGFGQATVSAGGRLQVVALADLSDVGDLVVAAGDPDWGKPCRA